ncbi:hypothetical protein ACO0LG_23155 [Undibacterium sp. Ji42W]|uniref:hypothetical protein n=1 Tax=Undibacterium sp. Ji42W TaxID=3413039 RepID=UPI003BF2A7CA
MKPALITICVALALSSIACSNKTEQTQHATETFLPRNWQENIVVDGEIIAANKTPLTVPGQGWDSRILITTLPEGSLVKKDQVIALFDAPKSRMELSQAELELLRKELAAETIEASDTSSRSTLPADSAKV